MKIEADGNRVIQGSDPNNTGEYYRDSLTYALYHMQITYIHTHTHTRVCVCVHKLTCIQTSDSIMMYILSLPKIQVQIQCHVLIGVAA